MLKNKEGKILRLLVKDNEYKDVLKECRKVEKQLVKFFKGGSRIFELYVIRVCLQLLIFLFVYFRKMG